ncbi:MAG: peroxide stress protein YaaA [Euryarchaeota archaeon]|nr:peroxide stress protein YaaA [Euryarchaeota archaeon]
MKKYLLILGCSNRKKSVSGKVRPLELYDGVNYRVLKKFFKMYGKPSNLEILIISAKYGFLTMGEIIEHYDKKMTAERARELHDTVMKKLKAFLKGKEFDEVHINLGKTYLEAIGGFERLFPNSKIVYDERGIGYKMQTMKKWLERIGDEVTKCNANG